MSDNHNSFLMIPSYVADHLEIDDATAILFGRLNALSNRDGFCFASTKYLAEISKCKERVIKNRLEKLKKLDFIRVFSSKKQIGWDRKIYTCNHYRAIENATLKEKYTKGTRVLVERAQACPLKGHTRAPYIDKPNLDKPNIPPLPPPSSVTEKASPEEEEELQRRVKERPKKYGAIKSMKAWRQTTLKNIREGVEEGNTSKSVEKDRRKEAQAYDMRSFKGFSISCCKEWVEVSKGQAIKYIRYDGTQEEWDQLPWRKS